MAIQLGRPPAQVMLDRASPVPLYHQLTELLLGQILLGDLAPREALPTERELVSTYNVSRITVRRALEELERRGYIQREQGRGTFVEPAPVQRGPGLTSFSAEILAQGMKPGVRLLALRREPASARVAHELSIPEGRTVWFIERLRLADDESIALNLSYLHLPDHISLTAAELTDEISLWALLETKGIHMCAADKVISAIFARDHQAKLLGIPKGAPLLLVEGVVFAAGGVPIEYHQIIGRADRYKFTIHITR